MGPLEGVRVVELAGIGPGPFCAMMLGDMGADVVRVDRADAPVPARPELDILGRNRRSVAVDLRSSQGSDVVLRLVDRADVLIEGFRPGTTERLGIGPDVCLARNPRLVYGRMTGWGQDGPLAARAGHDIDYIALAGALDPIGRAGEPPTPPLNLVGDFGGGGMLLAFGVVCGLVEARRSGSGQVIDAAMVDGAALLTTMIRAMRQAGMWDGGRGGNLLDSGAHYYDVYETADGGYMAVGALEPKFYGELVRVLGLDNCPQGDPSSWSALKPRVAAAFRSASRPEWEARFDGVDACVAPVLSMDEAPAHPHNAERATFVGAGGVVQPAPAPRFNRTPGGIERPPPAPGDHTEEVLVDLGFTGGEIAALREAGALR